MSTTINNTPHLPGVSRSKHRLADISHHFLSNENERSPAWQNTAIIPILLGARRDDYIVYELNRAFNRQDGHQQSSCMVLNIENRAGASSIASPSAEKLTRALASTDDLEDGGMPDYCLVPVTSPSTTLALQSDRCIIAVHSSLAGVRIAYDQLAFMASLETDFDVCVIMLDAKTIRDAKRFFGFLCANAKSLLALELECGGLLLQERHDRSATGVATETGSMDDEMATDLDSVAGEILRKFTAGARPGLATPLPAPVGVAGLLS
ncbi:MAG: hypothetical protein RRB22_07915 [Gammaproteobacteria bacterium]|nr:hypothetical protein [Gammaproteobacteria bacterium]